MSELKQLISLQVLGCLAATDSGIESNVPVHMAFAYR